MVRDRVGFWYDFERELNRNRAQGGANASEREAAAAYAKELGATGKITPYKALGLQTQVLKAGYSADQARAVSNAAVNLGLFAGMDAEAAGEAITAGISQYRLPKRNAKETGESANRLADIIATATNKTDANAEDFVYLNRYVGPLASAVGLTPEHIAAMGMQQARAGIKGPEMGTSIRDMLMKLLKPTADGLSVLAENKINLDDYATSRSPVSADGFISGAEAQFGPLKKKIKSKIQKWVAENANATMDEQFAFLSSALDAGTTAKGAQDKKSTAKYTNRYLGSTVEGLDYDGLMKALIAAGFSPAEFARLFTGKHAPRDIPIMGKGTHYEEDLKMLQTGAAGSAERQGALMQEGLPGAWDRFVSSTQIAALALEKASGSSQKMAGALDTVSDLLLRFSGRKPMLDQNPDGSRGIPGLINVRGPNRPFDDLGNWTGIAETEKPKSFWQKLGLPTITYSPNEKPRNHFSIRSLTGGSNAVQVTADTTTFDNAMTGVHAQLDEVSNTTAKPSIGLSGYETIMKQLDAVLFKIGLINSTPIRPTGFGGGIHADIGASGGGGGGW